MEPVTCDGTVCANLELTDMIKCHSSAQINMSFLKGLRKPLIILQTMSTSSGRFRPVSSTLADPGNNSSALAGGTPALPGNALPGSRWHCRGYLPHFEGGEIPQTLTFRLYDSLPAGLLSQWDRELAVLEAEKQELERRKRIEKALDAGHGSCLLRQPKDWAWSSAGRTIVASPGQFPGPPTVREPSTAEYHADTISLLTTPEEAYADWSAGVPPA